MRRNQRQGLFALANVSGVSIGKVNSGNIGFMLGPRLNASGRLESALASYHLLMENRLAEAGQLALQLDNQNRDRQHLTREITAKAELLALSQGDNPLILWAVDSDFNPGVVGLAASKLTESHYRPAIVGHVDKETTRCSCRSIAEFHITDALDECSELLIRHGGHAAAAGFTVVNDRFPEFVQKMNQIAHKKLQGLDLRQQLVADVELPLNELKPSILEYLELLEPTGYGNREALFVSRNLRVTNSKTVGSGGSHLKLSLSDGTITYDAIAFRLGHMLPKLTPEIDVVYAFEKNEFNGRENLQLNIRDIHLVGEKS